MGSSNVQIVRNMKAPAVPGRHYRLLCMTGEGKGVSYFLTGNRVVMGRGDKADIKVLDTKSSREHAELAKMKNKYVLTDLGSANGIVVNDLKVNQHTLSDGDKIIIGQTVFKFNVIKIKEEDEYEDEDYEEDGDDEDEQAPKKPKKTLIMALAALALVYLLFDDGGAPEKKKGKEPASRGATDISAQIAADLAKKDEEEDKELQKKLTAIIHRGQREFREGNYFRAIEEFNLALVLDPNNGQASFYLNKTKQSLDADIEDYFLKARREFDALKYNASGQTYCAILRLLEDYPEDERFKRAKNQIGNIEKALGMYEGEYKCFEE